MDICALVLSAGKGRRMNTDIAVSAIGDVPLHPGAEKYYKEIGVIA